MADRPIIFSAPMIGALLAGRKTQTRRILKPQPHIDQSGNFCAPDRAGKVWNWGLNIDGSPCLRNFVKTEVRFAVGDRLYVRENHALVPSSAYRMSEGVQQTLNPADRDEAAIYAAGWDRSKPRWRPSIHMPRWASRLTLVVTEVRVERLQDISERDAIAEGIERLRTGRGYYDPTLSHDASRAACRFGGYFQKASHAFEALWESINGPDAWAANPWVVAVSFSVHAGNIDQLAPADALDIAGAA